MAEKEQSLQQMPLLFTATQGCVRGMPWRERRGYSGVGRHRRFRSPGCPNIRRLLLPGCQTPQPQLQARAAAAPGQSRG